MLTYRDSLPPSPMAMKPLFLFLLILISFLSASEVSSVPFRHAIITTSLPLHPNQIRALYTMNIPISTADPCSIPGFLCDYSFPFRHLVSLGLHNCPYYLSLSSTSLQDLRSVTTLELINCPFNPQTNSTPPLSLILENLKSLTKLTISYSNLNEPLPDNWGNLNLTYIDLSNNQLQGEIPNSLRDLVSLKTLSLDSNSLCGDIPSYITDMKNLRNLNLKNNEFNDNVTKSNDMPSPYTEAVGKMAILLSAWILVIIFVVLLANCSM